MLFFTMITMITSAQSAGSKWFIIDDAEDKIVFVDTSSIARTENMLSVWSLIDYREPVFSATAQKKVKRIKTKYLFNTSSKSYTVIGTIFYDSTGGMITDSEIPQITGGNDEAYLSISSGSAVEVIYEKANAYERTGNINADPSEYLAELENKNELPYQDSTFTPEEPAVAENETAPIIPTEIPEEIPEQIEADTTGENITAEQEVITPPVPAVSEPEVPVEEPAVEEEPVAEKTDREYNEANDKVVKGTIFSDGTLYCYQVSSWKRKNVAEEEMQKLIDKGFNAYIMEVVIPGRGTWYRVRVGFFDSLEEAQADQRR